MKRIVSSKCWMTLLTPLWVIAFLAGSVLPVHAQTDVKEWKLVSQIGGSTQSVVVSGSTAYVGVGLRLNTVDISDPAHPKMLGVSQPLSDMLQDIVVSENKAYIAAGAAGLVIADVSDPTQPAILGTWQSSGYAEGLALMGKYVYLADGSYGLRVIDVSNPVSPKETGAALSVNYVYDAVASGNYIYAAAGESGLIVLDVKDPSQPVQVSQLEFSGNAYEVALSGNNVFIADAWAGVQVVDISTPQKPVLVATAATGGWSLGVAVFGKKLVSANGAQGSDVFDISDPANPKLLSSYLKEKNESDTNVRRVFIDNDTAYVADTLNGLRILDISHPKLYITQIGLFNQLSYARRLVLKGDYIYLAAGNEGAMYVINIADPLAPYQVSKFQADGIAPDVVLTGNFVTLGTFEDSSNCVTVVDISDPANPLEASAVDLQSLICGAPRQMAAQGNYVYIADEWGLSIYDLSDPGAVKTAGRIQLDQSGDQTIALSVSGNYAYVADAGNGLQIVDVSNPADPQLVRTFKQGLTVGSVISDGNTLYLGHYGEGISAMRNSAPGSLPSLLGTFRTMSSVEEVTVSENLLVSSEGSGGIEILDASNPAKLQVKQAIPTPGFAWASVISGDYIYVADSFAGLLVYARGIPGQQAATKTTNYPVSVTNYFTKGPGTDAPTFPEGIKKETSSVTCTISSSEDSGAGTLRECLSSAIPGETILFDAKVFTPQKPVTIHLQSALPELTVGSLTLDASNAGVILDGQHQVQAGLTVSSSYNTIMGIQFVNFTMDGITIGFPSQYNQIGGDHTVGDAPSGQGNVFAGNTNGLRALFTRYNTIKGNFFGTNDTGTAAAATNSIDIAISGFATHNTIGGPKEGEKNIISNSDRALDIASNSAAYNVVAGNYIGTDVTGTKAIPNTSWGVLIEVGGRNNIIGGTTPEERNIISGNNMGVCVSDFASTQNSIIGNYIGLDVSGEKALPNDVGSCIFQSAYNRVGGTLPGEANVISANKGNGVRFFGAGSINAFLIGNQIGLDASGKKTLGNNTGVLLDGGNHSMIGEGNIFSGNDMAIRIEYAGTSYNWIANNQITGSSQAAIMIDNNASANAFVNNSIMKSNTGILVIQANFNRLSANSISGVARLGIELRDGGNQNLQAPTIKTASKSEVSGTACPSCTVELFSDPGSQGLVYAGFVTADVSGAFTFSGNLDGPNVTAVATDAAGNTSPFSKAVPLK